MSARKIGLVLGLAAFMAAPAIAARAAAQTETSTVPEQRAALLERLRDAREVAADNARDWTQEPITSTDFSIQEEHINHLIQRLKEGKTVSAQQVDRALKSPDTPY